MNMQILESESQIPKSIQFQPGQDIPAYLSEAIERVKKRALNIIYPEAESYAHALQLGNLDRLDDRRVHLCYQIYEVP